MIRDMRSLFSNGNKHCEAKHLLSRSGPLRTTKSEQEASGGVRSLVHRTIKTLRCAMGKAALSRMFH